MDKKEHIPLLNFETFMEDELLLASEKLFDEGALIQLKNKGKGNWHAVVRAKGIFQVTANVFKGQVESHHCSCGKEICRHLVCSLYGIRQGEPERKSSIARPLKRQSSRRSALNTILQEASTEDLREFVKAYAMRERKFDLMFQTHFARQISEKTGMDVYQTILDKAFPVVTETNPQTSSRNQNLLINVAKEMLIHFSDAVSLEQFTDAFEMIQALIRKISYAVRMVKNPASGLLELLEQAHLDYRALFSEQLAPALRTGIMQSILDTVQLSYYEYEGMGNLYEQFLRNKPDGNHRNEFSNILRKKLANTHDFNRKLFLTGIYIRLHTQKESPEARDEWLINVLKDQYLFIESCNQLLSKGHIRSVLQLTDQLFYSKDLPAQSYHKIQLRIHEMEGNTDIALHSAIYLFEETNDLRYVHHIRNLSGETWSTQYKKLIQTLLEKGHPHNISSALQLAVKEEDPDTILKILDSHNDPELHFQYDRYIAGVHPGSIEAFFREYMDYFHRHHVGMGAANSTLRILEHLRALGLKKQASQLQEEIIRKFPERKSLQSLIG